MSPAAWSLAGLLLVILFFKPTGLLGGGVRARV